MAPQPPLPPPPPLWPWPKLPPGPSLRCRLGWHAPRKGALWNQGYYFTRCTRCGVDLVRTTFSGWEAPRGQRVVWRSRSELDLAEPPPALPPAPARTTSRAAAPPRRRGPSSTPSAIPDFMDEPEPDRPSAATPERPSAATPAAELSPEQRAESAKAGRPAP